MDASFRYLEIAEFLIDCFPNDVFIKSAGAELLSLRVIPFFDEHGELIIRRGENNRIIGVLVLGSFNVSFYSKIFFGGLKRLFSEFMKFRKDDFRSFFETFLFIIFDRKIKKSIQIAWIAVSANQRGKGIGTLLINDLKTSPWRNKYDFLVVRTLAKTPENIRFYEKAGFTKIRSSFGRVQFVKEW